MMYAQNFPRGTAAKTQNNPNASLTNQNSDAKRNRFSCQGCNFSCNSFQNFKIHLQQTNHEEIENAMTQNTSPLNKPENQKMNTTKNPANQMNTTRMPENQKMNTARIPENQWMNTARIQANQMNTTRTPENQKMNTARIPANQMNTTRMPENQKMNTARIPENQRMNATRAPGNQINNKRIPENQRINTTVIPGNQINTRRIPENQRINTTVIPENQKMNTTRVPDNQKMNTTRVPEIQKMHATKISGSLSEHIRRSLFFLTDYMHRKDREPLIGLEYVLEYKVRTKANRIEPKYVCEICNLETDLVPMVEHLAGFRHRKLYLAKEYPYVIKAPSNNKEDRSQFMRRMALEIEREEGTKMYKIDNAVRMESQNVKTTSANQSKRKTRWDIEGNQSQTRMEKALEYLESFEIDNDSEAMTVTGLTSKLTADIKLCSNKLKEEALFPARVARAKDVAMSIMQNVSREKRSFQNPVQQNPMINMPPQFNRGPPEKNIMQDGVRGPNIQRIDQTKMTPNASVPQKPQQFPFVPSKQNIQNLHMPSTTGSAQKVEIPQSNQNDPNTEDLQFLQKLMTLLKCLPQSSSSTENVQMDSKLMMLKSLLLDQTPSSETPQQKMMMQVASLTQDTANTDKGSLNQQLMMLMTSQNSTAMENVLLNQQMMMQVASMAKNTLSVENPQLNQNSVMQMGGVAQKSQNTGNVLMNKNLVSHLNQNVQNQQGGQMGSSSMMQMKPNAYQDQNMDTRPEYVGTSQKYGDFGYDRSVEGNYSSQANPYINQYDNIAESGVYRSNEQTRAPYSELSYKSGMQVRKWNDPPYRSPSTQVADTAGEPYSRVCLSPNFMAPASNTHEMYNSRQLDLPEWDERESDMLYIKRARLDVDHSPHYSESYYGGSRQQRGINTADLSADIRDRIRGKDLFTVSAILSEYADNRASK